MAERSRAPLYGLAVLLAAFLLKDFIFPIEGSTEDSSVQSKEIPSLHLNRYSGPSIKFSFW